MKNNTTTDPTQLLQALQRDLTTVLADLNKIKNKLGIDQPVPSPTPGPSVPTPPVNPPGGPHLQ